MAMVAVSGSAIRIECDQVFIHGVNKNVNQMNANAKVSKPKNPRMHDAEAPIIMCKILQIRKWQQKWFLKICNAYDIDQQSIIAEQQIIRKVPMHEHNGNRDEARQTRECKTNHHHNSYYVPLIGGYPRQIVCESLKIHPSKNKHGIFYGFLTNRKLKHKHMEIANFFSSSIDLASFDDKCYQTLCQAIAKTKPLKNVLVLGAGDARLLFELFFDFNTFPSIQSIHVVEVDDIKFAELECILDNCFKNINETKKHTFKIQKCYEKRVSGYSVMPIQKSITHRLSGRRLVFHRKPVWDVLGKHGNSNDGSIPKYVNFQVILSMLHFTPDSQNRLFAKYLKHRKPHILISTQTIPRNIQQKIQMCEAGYVHGNDGHECQTITCYAKCKKCQCNRNN